MLYHVMVFFSGQDTELNTFILTKNGITLTYQPVKFITRLSNGFSLTTSTVGNVTKARKGSNTEHLSNNSIRITCQARQAYLSALFHIGT